MDDAPDSEIFVILVSDKVLNAENVLKQLRGISVNANIGKEISVLFPGCDYQSVTVLKNQE